MEKSVKEVHLCRICMDDDSSGLLISPCRCSGSLSHIHEECLKTWLASKQSDMKDSHCEICKTKFLMRFKLSSRCTPLEGFNEGITHFLFLPMLIIVMAVLVFIIYVLSKKLMEDPGTTQEQMYAIGLIMTCGLSFTTIVVLVANAFKDTCITSSLEEWHIFDQHFHEEEHVYQGENIEFKIDHVPSVIRIRGRKVKTFINQTNKTFFRIRTDNSNMREINYALHGRRYTMNQQSENSPKQSSHIKI